MLRRLCFVAYVALRSDAGPWAGGSGGEELCVHFMNTVMVHPPPKRSASWSHVLPHGLCEGTLEAKLGQQTPFILSIPSSLMQLDAVRLAQLYLG